MSENHSGSTGHDDLDRAFDYIRQLVSAIWSLQACAVGCSQIAPSATDVKRRGVDAFRAAALELFRLVTGGKQVLDPVESELTEAASGTVGAHGAYGPNAHIAILRLADGVLSDLMTMGGGFDLGGINLANLPNLDGFCQKVAGVGRGELNRLLAEAEREYQAARRKPAGRADLGGPPAEAKSPVHSDDFRSVNWYGTEYTFTATQAACLKVLWENWERGTPQVGEQTILEDQRVDSAQNRLSHVFDKGKHPAWGRMIVPGSTKGTFRLAGQ